MPWLIATILAPLLVIVTLAMLLLKQYVTIINIVHDCARKTLLQCFATLGYYVMTIT
jgi:hypothetical protein